MDAASLSIGAQLGEGGCSHVHEVTDGNIACACKVFLTKTAFEAEKAAYERIQRVDALRGRVPDLYSVPAPFVILMENVEGTSLEGVSIPRSERAEIKKQLTETLDLLHREAGVYHGDIYPRNIMVKEGHAKLLDFSVAVMKEDVAEEDREVYAEQDRRALRAIFFEMGSGEAKQEALEVIDRMRQPCPQHGFNGEEQLAEILPRTGSSNEELLDAITTVLPAPAPSIAVWVANRLHWRGRHDDAVDVLRSCIARYERQGSSALISNETLFELKEHVAHLSGRSKRFVGSDDHPSIEELYEDAVGSYLRSSPENGKRSGADKKVLELRYELAKQLNCHRQATAALRVCVRALEEAGVPENDAEGEEIHNFVETMSWLLQKVKDRELWDRAAKLIGYDEKTYEQIRAESLY